MNIHLPAILMFTSGTRFWHTAMFHQWLFFDSTANICISPDKASSEGSSTVAAVNWQPRRPMCCKALRNCGSCMYYLDSSLVWLEWPTNLWWGRVLRNLESINHQHFTLRKCFTPVLQLRLQVSCVDFLWPIQKNQSGCFHQTRQQHESLCHPRPVTSWLWRHQSPSRPGSTVEGAMHSTPWPSFDCDRWLAAGLSSGLRSKPLTVGKQQ